MIGQLDEDLPEMDACSDAYVAKWMNRSGISRTDETYWQGNFIASHFNRNGEDVHIKDQKVAFRDIAPVLGRNLSKRIRRHPAI